MTDHYVKSAITDEVETACCNKTVRDLPKEDTIVLFRALSDCSKEPVCSAHGNEKCGTCSPIRLVDITAEGECRGCGSYGETGMHWDTCAYRYKGEFLENKEQALQYRAWEDWKRHIRGQLFEVQRQKVDIDSALAKIILISEPRTAP